MTFVGVVSIDLLCGDVAYDVGFDANAFYSDSQTIFGGLLFKLLVTKFMLSAFSSILKWDRGPMEQSA